jgi:cation diffusion facilitator family transporter
MTQADTRTRAALRITLIGLAANVILMGFKFAAGIVGQSRAVLADAVHSLTDLATDLAVIIGMRYWSAPPDPEHPYGHRRLETAVTVAIGMALAAVGIGIAYDSLASIREHHAEPPGWIAFAAAAASIVVKEVVYRATVVVGKRIRSAALIANAWHHRSDALSSIPAAIAVAVAAVYPSWAFLDHVGAVAVSLLILQAAWRVVAPAGRELVDAGAPPEVVTCITRAALAVDGVDRVHAVRTRFLGSALQVDLHVMVRPTMTVREGHDISENVKEALLSCDLDVVDAIVHLEPDDESALNDSGPFKEATPR